MKHASTLVPILASLTLTACGGSGGRPPPDPMPPPFTTTTNFTAFLRTQTGAAVTTETALPADVEMVDFAFTDDDDETEFDDVIAAAP